MPAEIDYLHGVVSYKKVVATEGSIAIDSSDWKVLEDKSLYNVRFLTTGAYACSSSSDMVACAANRGDCIALIDHANPTGEYDVDEIRNEIGSYITGVDSEASDPASFAAAFTPWIKTNFTGDEYVPASFGYLLAYARSIKSNPLWKAVAGVQRGVIPELTDVSYKLSNAECEVLQARATTDEVGLDDAGDNIGFAINPICLRRYSGFNGGANYVINGNRTLHVNKSIETNVYGDLIATSFLNVRALITEISKTLYDASVAFTFEQNNDILWINFKSMITPLLNKMQSSEGIEGYRLDRVITDKKARLCARLVIVPIEAVEDFEISIYLENSLDEPITIVE